MLPPRDRLIVALDVSSVEAAQAMVAQLCDTVSFYKIGYQLGFAGGITFARPLGHTGGERESRHRIADRLAHFDRRLHCRTQRDDFVDIDSGAWGFAGHLRNVGTDHRHPRRAANQEHAIEPSPRQTCLGKRFLR